MHIGLLKTTELIVSVGVLLIVNPFSSGQPGPAILIHGHVVNSAGQGISGVRVEVIPENLNISLVPSTITDDTGGYTIASQIPGRLRLLAFKEGDGYPDTLGLVFTTGDQHFPLIDATYGQVLDNVDIVLPPPDGVIQGIVRNAKTGSIAAQARITMNWVEKPEVMYSSYLKSDGTFLFALPSRPIAIEITAPGFKAWHYGSSQSDEGFAFLRPGSNTKVDIGLEPEMPVQFIDMQSSQLTPLAAVIQIAIANQIPLGIVLGAQPRLCDRKLSLNIKADSVEGALSQALQGTGYVVSQQNHVYVLMPLDATSHESSLLDYRFDRFSATGYIISGAGAMQTATGDRRGATVRPE